MKNSIHGKWTGLLSACLLAGLLLTGCNQETPAPQPTAVEAGTFTGQKLPDKVEQLDGTPLYSISEELTTVAKAEDACFLLIAPQDPTKALLVKESGTKPAELATRESKMTKFSGSKSTMKSESLVAHVKENYQLDLQVDNGEVVVLSVSAPDATPDVDAGAEGE